MLVQGGTNGVGYLVPRCTGLPVVKADAPELWDHPEALMLLYAAGLLTVLSAWMLLSMETPPSRPPRWCHRPERQRRSGQFDRR